jgi:molybdate transport system substrate-binding protein
VNGARAALAVGLISMTGPCLADEPIRVFAAGSLVPAFKEIAQNYQAEGGPPLALTFGPAGVLAERIEKGEAADLFASANMEHPRRLARENRASPVVVFVRNNLCGIARRELGLSEANFLDRVLDPAVILATSTPKADPAGDYAWAMFAKAEAVHPGGKALLEGKARQMMGGPGAPAIPAGANPIVWALREKHADIFLAYCSAGISLPAEIVSVAPPPALSVGADYGLTVLHGDPARETAAFRFAFYLLSPDGQAVLSRFGFITPYEPSRQP